VADTIIPLAVEPYSTAFSGGPIDSAEYGLDEQVQMAKTGFACTCMDSKIQKHILIPGECRGIVVWIAFDDEGYPHRGKETYNWMLWNRATRGRQRKGTSGIKEMRAEWNIVERRDRMEIDVEMFRVRSKLRSFGLEG
jgi:hypothetical protein